jgi:surface protein
VLLHSSSVMLALKQALSLSSTSLRGSAVSAFVFGINTANISAGSSTSTQFKLPLTTSTGLNAVVDWGDSTTDTITVFNAAEVTHTYASSGTYTISITGTLPGFRFVNAGDKLKIINISSWGVLDITTDSAFRGCTNLTCSATDAPTITSTSLLSTFRACTNFNGNVGNWDVSAVTNMISMFVDATAFNNGGSSSIGNWNTSSVTNMSSMLSFTGFNQNIGSWNTSLVTNMSSMFQSATAFNNGGSSSIENWNTSSVINMSSAFRSATAFNQNIGSWNVEAVTNITNFMLSKTAANYSATNLDAIYNGWSTQSVQPNLTITFGSIKYTAAGQTGRDTLDNAPNNWTITDGGI